MTERAKAYAGGAAASFASASANFVEQGMLLAGFPPDFVGATSVLVSAAVGFVAAYLAVYAMPDGRSAELRDARVALGKATQRAAAARAIK